MSKILFSEKAWNDYLFWQDNDRKLLSKINRMLKEISRDGAMHGIGKPEPLSGNLSGKFSRRINDSERLVYEIINNNIYIIQCKGHYCGK